MLTPRWLADGVSWMVVLAYLGIVLGRLARWSWLGDLAGHFRVQYAVVLLGAAPVLLSARRLPEAAMAGSVGLLSLHSLAPFYRKRSAPASRATRRVLLANVLWQNRSYPLLQRAIREAQPDVIVLIETTATWIDALAPLKADYPHAMSAMSARGFGILVLSKTAFAQVEVVWLGEAGFPSIVAQVPLEGHRVTIVATHPYSPITPRRARLRNQQLQAVAAFIQRQPTPLMMLGDLNTTPWAPAFEDFLHDTKLRDSSQGFGLQPTWPTAFPVFQIPLDHCLVSSEICITRRQVGPYIGSDHYPVIVDFSVVP